MILDKPRLRRVTMILIAASLWSCAPSKSVPASVAVSGRLPVVCTISTLCSLVVAVGGGAIDLRGLVPVGASPETYEPAPSDVVALARARVIFENGLGLEAWLDKLLGAGSTRDQVRVTLADAVPADAKASGNPHLWMDPVYARAYVAAIEATLAHADPARASFYAANAIVETRKLVALERWTRAQIATIPADRRTMITFHDAWYYFDRRFGIKDVGAIEPSPGKEPSPGWFAALVKLARDNHVRAVFAEPQYSPKLAAALQSSAGIKVMSDLYDDTLIPSSGISDYDGMMRYDVRAIVSALRS